MEPILAAFLIAVWMFWSVLKRLPAGSWAVAARRLGLGLTSGRRLGQRRMAGTIGRHGVLVQSGARVSRRGPGGRREPVADIEVAFPGSLGLGLRLDREALLAGLGRVMAGSGVVDQGGSGARRGPARLLARLSPTQIAQLHELVSGVHELTIDDRGIHVVAPAPARDPDGLVGRVRGLVGLAEHLGKLATAEAPAGARQAPPRREARPAPDSPPKVRRTERVAEARGADQPVQTDAAAKETSGLERQDDAADTSEPGLEGAEDQPPEPAETGPAEAPAPAPAGGALLVVEDVCRDLFSAGVGGLEARRRFETRYTGRTVRWSGTLEAVEESRFDLVFGPAPLAKASFAVHDLDPARKGGLMAHAIVALEPGSRAVLASRVGGRITFEGRLERCDPYARRLFVAEGRIAGPGTA